MILVGILKAAAPPAAIGSTSMAAAGASAAAATKIAAGMAVAGVISSTGGTILLGQLLDTTEGINEQLDGKNLLELMLPNFSMLLLKLELSKLVFPILVILPLKEITVTKQEFSPENIFAKLEGTLEVFSHTIFINIIIFCEKIIIFSL